MKRGIDISAWQGNVNFDKVKKSGVEFAIIRAGFGAGTLDKRFKAYALECTRVGIPFGIYWFSYAYNTQMAVNEAKAALKAVSGFKLDYPIFWDFEYDSVNYAMKKGVAVNKKLASDMARAFMSTIKAAGYHTGNYTNLDFSKRMFDNDILKNYPLWAARYTKDPVDIVNGAILWQYSSTGKVSGINGNVDMDYALAEIATNQPVEQGAPVTVELKPQLDSYGIPAMYDKIFNPVYYVDRYDDLAEAVKTQITLGYIHADSKSQAWWLYQHFLKYGMAEGRQACEAFDVLDYKNRYADLREAFGDDLKAYYYHYMQFGFAEIRDGKRAPF